MRVLDRLLFTSFLRAYLICLVSLLSLYVVVDLFTNVEDFAQQAQTLRETLLNVGRYYGYKVAQIFDRLCEPILLLAAMFTVAWMQRNNELLPLLSAGVPTRRVVRPVIGGVVVMLGLGLANQEFLIPRIADALLADRDDHKGDKTLPVQGAYEPNGVHLEGQLATRQGMQVRPFFVTLPESMAAGRLHIKAESAVYLPPDAPGPYRSGWLITGTQPAVLDDCPPVLKEVDPGRYFLPVQDVDFDVLTRRGNWYMFATTLRLKDLLDRPDGRRQPAVAVLFHMRLTRPILSLILIFMGLAVILRDQNRNIFIGTGLCLAMCALFFCALFACKQLGDSEYLSPALAAWLPVLVFGPLAFTMFDAIHT
ncbi:MAG TPA: LptF/LptG family permease [Gemmataceae bacterium]|nr:LptF/LptG family permease [Gemmataceae bacterium]